LSFLPPLSPMARLLSCCRSSFHGGCAALWRCWSVPRGALGSGMILSAARVGAPQRRPRGLPRAGVSRGVAPRAVRHPKAEVSFPFPPDAHRC
jgi:hypothetical protein